MTVIAVTTAQKPCGNARISVAAKARQAAMAVWSAWRSDGQFACQVSVQWEGSLKICLV
jgi:hypothetical protein